MPKLLPFDKTKKHIYFVLCSLIRNFAHNLIKQVNYGILE